MTRHRFWIGFAVLAVSLLLVTTETQATTQSKFDNSRHQRNNGVVFMNHEELLRMAKRFGLKVYTIKLSKNDTEKLAKSPAKGCGCALTPDDDFGFGSCFRGCLTAWGVTATTLTGCAVVCASDNLVGCAICAGVSEWIAGGCAMKCAWRNAYPVETMAKARLRPSRAVRQQK